MLKAGQREYSGRKLPIRSPRITKKSQQLNISQSYLFKKYLKQSINAFFFRKCQDCLHVRPQLRQLNHLASSQEYVNRYFTFSDTCQKIRALVIERVEKDFIFGLNFHSEWKVLEKYVHLQRNLKQRNLYNRYYFSSCPPKISQITQPTIVSLLPLKAPETNSTIQLKVLTHNIDLMLVQASSSNQFHTPEKKMKKEKSEKRRRVKMYEQPPEESYGLIGYKKDRKSKGRGSQSRGSKMNFCVTPQPHASIRDFESRSPLQVQPRMSERLIKSKSNSKKLSRSKK